jgi:hypothetical protein
MTDAIRLEQALKALGYAVSLGARSDTVVGCSGSYTNNDRVDFTFRRGREGEAFSADSTNLAKLQEIQRKYSEITVREFAKRKGYTIQAAGNTFTLTNRRDG